MEAATAAGIPMLGPSRVLTDRSCLLLGSAARLAQAASEKGVAHEISAGGLAQGSVGGLAQSPKVLEMVSSSGRRLTIDIRTTAAAAAVQPELPPVGGVEECDTGAAVVDAPLRGGSAVRSCLALQQVPAAGWLPALRQVKKVDTGGCERLSNRLAVAWYSDPRLPPTHVQLIREAREQEARWPHFRDDLSSLVLHIPADQVARLKALAATPVARSDGAPAAAACSDGGPVPTHSDGAPARSDGNSATVAAISTNDAVAGLVWTLMCQLRGRPLPGQQAPLGCSSSSGNSLGLAVDLRRNGLQGVLPLDLFANATWCLHIPIAASAADVREVPSEGPAEAGKSKGSQQEDGGSGGDGTEYVEALRQGARKVRSTLLEIRDDGPASAWGIVDLAAAQCQAPLSSQVQGGSRRWGGVVRVV